MIVILDNLRSALNVGSIIRTADGLGVEEVWLCGITPGLENERVKKTALGAEESVEIKYFKRTEDAIEELRSLKYTVFSLEIAPEAKDIEEVKVPKKVGLVLGNEVSGISKEILRKSDQIVKITMNGKKESLNVTVAYAIAAYTLLKSTL